MVDSVLDLLNEEETQEEVLKVETPDFDPVKHIASILGTPENKSHMSYIEENFELDLHGREIDVTNDFYPYLERMMLQTMQGDLNRNLMKESPDVPAVVKYHNSLANILNDTKRNKHKSPIRNQTTKDYQDEIGQFLPINPVTLKHASQVFDNLNNVRHLVPRANDSIDIQDLIVLNAIGNSLDDRTEFDKLIQTDDLHIGQMLNLYLGFDKNNNFKKNFNELADFVYKKTIDIENKAKETDITDLEHDQIFDLERIIFDKTGIVPDFINKREYHEDLTIKDIKSDLEARTLNGFIRSDDQTSINVGDFFLINQANLEDGRHYEFGNLTIEDISLGSIVRKGRDDFEIFHSRKAVGGEFGIRRNTVGTELIKIEPLYIPGKLGDKRRKENIPKGATVRLHYNEGRYSRLNFGAEGTLLSHFPNAKGVIEVEFYTRKENGMHRVPEVYNVYYSDLVKIDDDNEELDDLNKMLKAQFEPGKTVKIKKSSEFYKKGKTRGKILRKNLFGGGLDYVVQFKDGSINQYDLDDLELLNPPKNLEKKLKKELAGREEKGREKVREIKSQVKGIVSGLQKEISNQKRRRKRFEDGIKPKLERIGCFSPEVIDVFYKSTLGMSKVLVTMPIREQLGELKENANYSVTTSNIIKRIYADHGILIDAEPNIDCYDDFASFLNGLEGMLKDGFIVHNRKFSKNDYYGLVSDLTGKDYEDNVVSRLSNELVAVNNYKARIGNAVSLVEEQFEGLIKFDDLKPLRRLFPEEKIEINSRVIVSSSEHFKDKYHAREEYLIDREKAFPEGSKGVCVHTTEDRAYIRFGKENRDFGNRWSDGLIDYDTAAFDYRNLSLINHNNQTQSASKKAVEMYNGAVSAIPNIIAEESVELKENLSKYLDYKSRMALELILLFPHERVVDDVLMFN